VGGRRLIQVLVAARMRRRRRRLHGSANPGSGQAGDAARLPETVPSVDGGERRHGGSGDVVVDGGGVRRGAGRRRRGRVVVTERVGVVLERDAHRLPVVDGRRSGHVARRHRDAAADLVRLCVD